MKTYNKILLVSCVLFVWIAFSSAVRAQDTSVASKVIDQFLATGVVGALCIVEAWLIRKLWLENITLRGKQLDAISAHSQQMLAASVNHLQEVHAIREKHLAATAEHTDAIKELRDEQRAAFASLHA